MTTTVTYNGEALEIDAAQAETLLEMFQSHESGVIQLAPLRGYGTLYVAYGPGIPFIFDSTDD